VTAFASIYSAYFDRAYSRAAVWPRLEIFRSFSDNTFSYGVSNNGTGPALIMYAKVKNGPEYIKRWSDVEPFRNILQSHLGNRTLSPQNSITPLLFNGENPEALVAVDEVISIELCYCSIYEECWVIDRTNRPSSVENCVVDDKQVFLQ
jgi:hypothetical protein